MCRCHNRVDQCHLPNTGSATEGTSPTLDSDDAITISFSSKPLVSNDDEPVGNPPRVSNTAKVIQGDLFELPAPLGEKKIPVAGVFIDPPQGIHAKDKNTRWDFKGWGQEEFRRLLAMLNQVTANKEYTIIGLVTFEQVTHILHFVRRDIL